METLPVAHAVPASPPLNTVPMTPLVPSGHHGTATDDGGHHGGTNDLRTDHYTDTSTKQHPHPLPNPKCNCPLSSVPALMNPSRFRLRVRVEDLRVGVPIGLHSNCTDATVDMEVLRRG